MLVLTVKAGEEAGGAGAVQSGHVWSLSWPGPDWAGSTLLNWTEHSHVSHVTTVQHTEQGSANQEHNPHSLLPSFVAIHAYN